MLDPQTILLTSAKWSLSRRKRGLRFDPRPQRSHAVDDGLERDSHLRHLVYRLPKLVGIDRLIKRAGADLLGSGIVGQQLNAHVAGGEGRRVDDEVVHPLFRVCLFGNGWDDDGLFWFDGHEFVWLDCARNAVCGSSGIINCDVASGGHYGSSVGRVRGQLALNWSEGGVVREAGL